MAEDPNKKTGATPPVTDEQKSSGDGGWIAAGNLRENTKRLTEEQKEIAEKAFESGYDPFHADAIAGRTPITHTTSGRIATRMITRGLMGAGFFAYGNYAVRKYLWDYRPNNPIFMEYKLNNPVTLRDQSGNINLVRAFLHGASRFFDTIYGQPIYHLVKAVSPAERAEELAQKAVWFRNRNLYSPFNQIPGRSIGQEVTSVSFDFAMASAGDAWGRNIVNMLDPALPAYYYNDDGTFSPSKFAKGTAESAWKILSYSQGEDWAVALPYVYQCRYQRQALNNAFKGFKRDSDLGLNGGSHMINRDGFITGSYAKAGALDLQLRFTGYNVLTLMFRNAHDAAGEVLDGLWNAGVHLRDIHVPDDPISATIGFAGDALRYVAKSTIKAGIYMTPAVPFFWTVRVPQFKSRGAAIYNANQETESAVQVTGQPIDPKDPATRGQISTTFYTPTREKLLPENYKDLYIGMRKLDRSNTDLTPDFNPYGREHLRGVFDKALNPLGEFCDTATNRINTTLDKYQLYMDKAPSLLRRGVITTAGDRRDFVQTFVNASTSYTPYMIAKAETAIRWDNPLMDDAIYRFIDGIMGLDVNKTKQGLKDIQDLIVHPATFHEVVTGKRDHDAKTAFYTQVKQKPKADDALSPDTKVAAVQLQQANEQAKQTSETIKNSALHSPKWSERAAPTSHLDTVPPHTTIH